jgi:hypothetical protein
MHKKNLCSYRHIKSTDEETGDETSDDLDDSEENETESCDFCGEVFGDIDDLIDHYGITGHNLK